MLQFIKMLSRNFMSRYIYKLTSLFCGRVNSCRDKIRYPRQDSAERAAVNFGVKRKSKFDVYNCWYCHQWHIGGHKDLTPALFLRLFVFWILVHRRKYEKREPKLSS